MAADGVPLIPIINILILGLSLILILFNKSTFEGLNKYVDLKKIQFLLYALIVINFLITIYFTFILERIIQLGRNKQSQCKSDNRDIYEYETIRYNVYKNMYNNSWVYWTLLILSIIITFTFLLTVCLSNDIDFISIGFYVLFGIYVIIGALYLGVYNKVRDEVSYYIYPESFNEYRDAMNLMSEFFTFFYTNCEPPINVCNKASVLQFQNMIITRIKTIENISDTQVAKAIFKSGDIMKYIDFNKDSDTLISFISEWVLDTTNSNCTDIIVNTFKNTATATATAPDYKLCPAVKYKKDNLIAALNILKTNNDEQLTGEVYKNISRVRLPAIGFLVIMMAVLYDWLHDKYNYRTIVNGISSILVIILLILFVLKYIGILQR